MGIQYWAYVSQDTFYLYHKKQLLKTINLSHLDELMIFLSTLNLSNLMLMTNLLEEQITISEIEKISNTHQKLHLETLLMQQLNNTSNLCLHWLDIAENRKYHGKIESTLLINLVNQLKTKINYIECFSILQWHLFLNQMPHIKTNPINLFCTLDEQSGDIRLSIFKHGEFKYSQLKSNYTQVEKNLLYDITLLLQYCQGEQMISLQDQIICWISYQLKPLLNIEITSLIFQLEFKNLDFNITDHLKLMHSRYLNLDLLNQQLEFKKQIQLKKWLNIMGIFVIILSMITLSYYFYTQSEIQRIQHQVQKLDLEINSLQKNISAWKIPPQMVEKIHLESLNTQRLERQFNMILLYRISNALQKIGTILTLNQIEWNQNNQIIMTFDLNSQKSFGERVQHIQQLETEFNNYLNPYEISSKVIDLPQQMNRTDQKTVIDDFTNKSNNNFYEFKIKFSYESKKK